MNKSIRYATDRRLPESIEIKRQNIISEIKRRTGMNVKISLIQTQRYLAEELKLPKLKFDMVLWNKVVGCK
jgi:hypothetical protein